ncbi:MAG: ribosome silencing factor [Lentisphaeria bacterium]|nr:ribosome silencing factor [Lentisphaeria bacterium]
MVQDVTAIQTDDTQALARRCVSICEERKAEDVILFDVRSSSILADYYLICTGTSVPHINAIVAHLKRDLAAEGILPRGHDGDAASQWVVLDYGVLLVHVIAPERRGFYRIEELWNLSNVVYRGGQGAPAADAAPVRQS